MCPDWDDDWNRDSPWERWEKNHFFILVDKIAVPSNMKGWSTWFEKAYGTNETMVAFTKTDIVEVSTVFLGINHNFKFDGSAPILFETMAFHKLDTPKKLLNDLEVEWDGEECMRCGTWEEAELQHKMMVAEVISKEYLGTPEQLKAMVEEIFQKETSWQKKQNSEPQATSQKENSGKMMKGD
jgi:hypothetical protein